MRGRVRLRLQGLGAERVLNLLWKKGIPLHRVKRTRLRGVEVEVAQKHQQGVVQAAEEKGFRVTVLNRGLGSTIMEGLKRRWGLCVGLLLGAGLCLGSMQYIWQVEVEDAGKYAGEVRLFLQEEGLRPGVKKAAVNTAELQEKLQWRLPKVKWVWVKREGAKLTFRLEQGTPAEEEGEAPGPVVAAKDGVLERLTVFAGTPVCKEGDIVKRGQVLILGEETGRDGTIVPVRARGEAVAKVWVQKAVRMDTRELVTTPTGRQAERILYQTPFGTFTFEKEPDFLLSHRVRESVPLPGAWAPITVVKETFVECSGQWQQRNAEEVAKEARKAAEEALIRTWPRAQNIDKSVKFSMIERGIIEVVATAVFTEDIAQFGEMPEGDAN